MSERLSSCSVCPDYAEREGIGLIPKDNLFFLEKEREVSYVFAGTTAMPKLYTLVNSLNMVTEAGANLSHVGVGNVIQFPKEFLGQAPYEENWITSEDIVNAKLDDYWRALISADSIKDCRKYNQCFRKTGIALFVGDVNVWRGPQGGEFTHPARKLWGKFRDVGISDPSFEQVRDLMVAEYEQIDAVAGNIVHRLEAGVGIIMPTSEDWGNQNRSVVVGRVHYTFPKEILTRGKLIEEYLEMCIDQDHGLHNVLGAAGGIMAERLLKLAQKRGVDVQLSIPKDDRLKNRELLTAYACNFPPEVVSAGLGSVLNGSENGGYRYILITAESNL